MTDEAKNALITKHMSADPDPQWEAWAWVRRSPERYHRVPRDFALPANTLKLVEWASGQEWYGDDVAFPMVSGKRVSIPVACHVRHYLCVVARGRIDAPETALEVRDVIAAKLKEIAGD